MSPIIDLQRRFMELGRIRLGEKDPERGFPRKLSKFRLTSASEPLLRSAAAVYGGEVRPWQGAPDEGMWELYTESDRLNVIMPPTFSEADGSPTHSWSQWYELWSAGGCQRRCDGEREYISGEPCLCDSEERECSTITRINVILPEVAGIGVWRLQTSGYYAATETTGTLALLQRAAEEHEFIPAVLRLEQRHVKRSGSTLRFAVPVIELPETRIADLIPGAATAIRAPASPGPKPALPAASPEPRGEEGSFDWAAPSWQAPPLAEEGDAVEGGEGAPAPFPAPEPPSTVPAPEEDELASALQQLGDALEQLGQGDQIEEVMKLGAQYEPEEYLAWVRRQYARAQAKLAERAAG